jgi:hypothetical protein
MGQRTEYDDYKFEPTPEFQMFMWKVVGVVCTFGVALTFCVQLMIS